MLGYLASLVIILVVVYISVVLINEYISRKRADFYVKQGFSPEITFGLSGYAKLLIKGLDKKNVLEHFYERYLQAKREGAPAIIYNEAPAGLALIQLIDTNLIKEFANKDNEVSIKYFFNDQKLKLGFFAHNEEFALKQRVIFSEFFRIDNLSKLIPSINKVIENSFNKARSRDGTLKITKSQQFVDHLMVSMVNMLIFGENAEILKEEIGDIIQLIYSDKLAFNLLNQISRDWLNRLNILPEAHRVNKRTKSLEQKLENYILERDSKPKKYREERNKFCLINMMLDYNEKAKEGDKLTMSDMIGNCNVFLLAGFDTTNTSICSMLFSLAHSPEVFRRLGEAVTHLNKPDLTFTELDSCELLEKVVRESIRINPPAAYTATRQFLKDFSLGRYKFRKGDLLFISQAPMIWDEDAFAAKRTFDVEAVDEQNKKQYLPFYLGRRNCVGQQLAQLELKLVALFVASRFTLNPLSAESRYCLSFTMQIRDCDVEISDAK